jgi:hypothetical protein
MENVLKLFDDNVNGQEFKEYKDTHSSWSDFWQHCPRPDWMLLLLIRTPYQNPSKLWEFLNRLRTLELPKDSIPAYREWQRDIDRIIEIDKVHLEQEFAEGIIDHNQLWFSAWVCTDNELRNMTHNVLIHTMAVSGIPEALQGASIEEVNQKTYQAVANALKETRKIQADLLREVYGNAFLTPQLQNEGRA